MGLIIRLRPLDEIQGAWRDVRQAARFAQVVLGFAAVANISSLLFTSGPIGDARWLTQLNYVAVIFGFSAITGGFWAEKRRHRQTPQRDRSPADPARSPRGTAG